MWAAVKSMSRIPVASSTISRAFCVEDCKAFRNYNEQWRLNPRHYDVGLSLAPNVRAQRPPDRGSRHALEHDDAGARRAPYAVQKRERDADCDTLLDREDDDGRGGRDDQQEFTKRLPIDRDDLANSDDSERDEQQDAAERRMRDMAQQRGAERHQCKN